MEIVCGIDEAGRGPLAGPVTAAAVVLNGALDGLADSKQLTPARRSELAATIRDKAALWGVGWATPAEIDRLNILQATLLAMRRAYEIMQRLVSAAADASLDHGGRLLAAAPLPIAYVLVDGLQTPTVPTTGDPAWGGVWRALVGGDQRVPAIQAASIIAKTTRDAWMTDYARHEPQYRFELHKGYPTRLHRTMIARYGASRIQRRSFRCSLPSNL